MLIQNILYELYGVEDVSETPNQNLYTLIKDIKVTYKQWRIVLLL